MYWKIFLVLLVCFIIFISLLLVKEENCGQNIEFIEINSANTLDFKIEENVIDISEVEKEIVSQELRKRAREEALMRIKIEEVKKRHEQRQKERYQRKEKEKQGMKIKSHGYTFISKVDDIKELKNMNTYVFFPDNLSSQNNHKSKKYKRYEKILELIQEMPKYDINITSLGSRAKKINRFILMNKKLNQEKITVESYNYDLANDIVNKLRVDNERYWKGENRKERLRYYHDFYFFHDELYNEGPYLITTVQNIFKIGAYHHYLLIDLSNFNDSAIEEIIRSYKQHLIDDGNVGFSDLQKFRHKVLSLITNINSNIKTMHKAVAGEL